MHISEITARIPYPALFGKLWGSRSHNTHRPDSDYDFSGVYVVPTKQVLGLENYKETIEKDGDEKPDFQFHEVRKFCGLLLKGNPSILEMLYTEREYVSTPEWDELRSIRDRFLSKSAVDSYVGYMKGQLSRLKKGGYLHTTGGEFNEKWAYHCVRLGMDARRIVWGNPPVVWKDTGSHEHALLMGIRSYKYGKEEVLAMIEELLREIEATDCQLPEAGDAEALNSWLLEVRSRNP